MKRALSTEKGLKTQLSGPAPPGGTAAGRGLKRQSYGFGGVGGGVPPPRWKKRRRFW